MFAGFRVRKGSAGISAPTTDSSLTTPLYSFADTDRLAQVSRGTSSRWLKGYSYWPRPDILTIQPPVSQIPGVSDAASFIDLIEVVAISTLKKYGFSLRSIRQINNYCKLELRIDRPLVTERFRTDGRDIFVKAPEDSGLLDVLRHRGEQAWEEVLEPFLEKVDYKDELARRWWPRGKDFPVMVDPDYGFGLPVVAGSGVRTELVVERRRAGATEEEIAEDFNLDEQEVMAALDYELSAS